MISRDLWIANYRYFVMLISRDLWIEIQNNFILLQVDESVLSSDNAEDKEGENHSKNYPWIQMALPGGGIVSVPLERASSGAGSVKQETDPTSPTPLVQPNTSKAGAGSNVTQADLLTVAAGEPVTHFNLDQLLEIVQSFQLDTTMASHDDLKTARDLVLAADLVSLKNTRTFLCLLRFDTMGL